MLKKPETVTKYTVPQLVSELLESVTIIHKFHLVSKSYSEHKALGRFYETIGDFADTLFETFAWRNNSIEIPCPTLTDVNAIIYLEKLANFVENARLATTFSDLQNQMDEVKTLIYGTLYKLKNLK
jgi:predicted DNA binding protein